MIIVFVKREIKRGHVEIRIQYRNDHVLDCKGQTG
jgi:hypothetical protein